MISCGALVTPLESLPRLGSCATAHPYTCGNAEWMESLRYHAPSLPLRGARASSIPPSAGLVCAPFLLTPSLPDRQGSSQVAFAASRAFRPVSRRFVTGPSLPPVGICLTPPLPSPPPPPLSPPSSPASSLPSAGGGSRFKRGGCYSAGNQTPAGTILQGCGTDHSSPSCTVPNHPNSIQLNGGPRVRGWAAARICEAAAATGVSPRAGRWREQLPRGALPVLRRCKLPVLEMCGWMRKVLPARSFSTEGRAAASARDGATRTEQAVAMRQTARRSMPSRLEGRTPCGTHRLEPCAARVHFSAVRPALCVTVYVMAEHVTS